MHYGEWNDGWGGAWAWLAMMVMMVAFWGGIVFVVVMLMRHGNQATGRQAAETMQPPAATSAPREILAERLARGEIELDDYRQRLEALRDDILR
jgi:putative membrane protein